MNVSNHTTVLHLYDHDFCEDCGKDFVFCCYYVGPMMLLSVVGIVERRAQPIQKSGFAVTIFTVPNVQKCNIFLVMGDLYVDTAKKKNMRID